MYELKTLELTSPYRDDFNGRPCAYLVGPYLLVKTHPFYLWGDCRKKQVYGRAYNYDVMLESQVSNSGPQPEVILKVLVTDLVDTLHEFYSSPTVFNGLLERLSQAVDFTYLDVAFTKTDASGYQAVYKSMLNSELEKPTSGCLKYQNEYWILSLHNEPNWDIDNPTYTGLESLDEFFRSKEIISAEQEYVHEVFLCDTNLKHEIGKVYTSCGEIIVAYLTAHRN